METTYKPTKSLNETIEETKKDFEKTYGRLMTNEEAVELTDMIRRNLRKEGKI